MLDAAAMMIELPDDDTASHDVVNTFDHGVRVPPAPVPPWSDREIRRLQQLVGGRLPAAPASVRTTVDTVLDQFVTGDIGADAAQRLITAIAADPALAEAVAGLEAAGALSGLVERWHQHAGLDRLAAAVADPATTAADLQVIVGDECWIFGARFAPPYLRSRLPVLDRIDVPLVRLDGAIHAVGVEVANLPDLVRRVDDHYAVGPAVHAAVDRLISQLRLLDQHAAEIRTELLVECRRAFGTVVIGHPHYLADRDAAVDQAVRDAIRTYNSHLAGIEVVTYQDLIEGSRRALLVAD